MWGICIVAVTALSAAGPMPRPGRVLATADTEGHVSPCRSCPVGVGLGGMFRRATMVTKSRESDPKLLLVDAGNFLFGPESLDSRGAVIVAAYNAMHYDAVNISYRDFRQGRDHTVELLHDATFDAISANLLEEETGKPLFRPYVVRRDASGRRIAILGLTDPPAGWEQLPELRRQLSGLRVEPSEQALATWLPRAAAESDRVIVLYYGSAAGLARVRSKAGERECAFVVGGATDVEDAAIAIPKPHGKSLVELSWGDAAAPKIKEMPVTPDVAADAAMQRLLAAFARHPGSSSPARSAHSSAR